MWWLNVIFCHFLQHFVCVRKISKFNQTRLGSACFEKFGVITVIYFEFLFHTCLQQMSPWKEHLKYNDCYLENIQTYNSKIEYILVFLFWTFDVWRWERFSDLVTYSWQIEKLKPWHWGLVADSQRVIWTAFAILAMFYKCAILK